MSTARADLLRIAAATISALDPRQIVLESVRLEGGLLLVRGAPVATLESFERIWVLAVGKAAGGMAEAVLEILGGRVAGGSLTTPAGATRDLPPLSFWSAGHPLPNSASIAAAAEALHIARRARPDDLLLVLISGGASSLWAAPAAEIRFHELKETSSALMRAGATIEELNCVRKHLSSIAGGRLAASTAATVLTLALSDVGPAPDHVVGSGPTLPDPTTFQDALDVLAARGVTVSSAVMRRLQRGAAGEVQETPKGTLANSAGFYLLADVGDAVQTAADEATRLGYRVQIQPRRLAGEARSAGIEIAATLLGAQAAGAERAALIWGGETTVVVRGDGLGGRSQELALAAAIALEGFDGVHLAAFGTDGVDGPTPAAGAIVDGYSLKRAALAGLDARAGLNRNDSHTLLSSSGDLVITGPTGTNLNDLVIGLIG